MNLAAKIIDKLARQVHYYPDIDSASPKRKTG
jgi:hypothetical protein